MHIQEIFSFGKYKGLKLIDVFRGTLNIDRSLLRAYAEFILNGDLRLHYEKQFEVGAFQCVDKFELTDNEIKAFLFYEKGFNENGIPFGDFEEIGSNIERDIELCLSVGNQAAGYELGGFLSLAEFNKDYNKRFIVGADPGYLSWCIENLESFYIPIEELEQLEKFKISVFHGVKVVWKQGGLYEYSPNVEIKTYKFDDKIHQLNIAKIDSLEANWIENHRESHDSGPSAYGYDSWEEMSFNEAYEEDSDAWDHDNQ